MDEIVLVGGNIVSNVKDKYIKLVNEINAKENEIKKMKVIKDDIESAIVDAMKHEGIRLIDTSDIRVLITEGDYKEVFNEQKFMKEHLRQHDEFVEFVPTKERVTFTIRSEE